MDFIGGSVEVFWSHTSTRGLMSTRTWCQLGPEAENS